MTLAATDVTPVRRGVVEDAVPVTGNLQPLERIEVRARLEGQLENVLVREGERVRAGQVLARFEAEQQASVLESAEADRTSAKTELATTEWNLEQTRELFKEGAVPECDVKAGEQAVAAARARLAAAESRWRTASDALRDTRVVAPANAVVERRLTSNGEHVNRGAPLFTLVRTETLELTGAVPARVANRVKVGQLVRFNADARTFTGKVARVSPTIDAASRSVGVYIQIPNYDGGLKGGAFASGRIVSQVAGNALIVPTAAIHQEQNTGAPFVYRIAGETIERRPVQLGIIDEAIGIAEVKQGLEEGDRVVTGTVGTVSRTAKVVILGGETGRSGSPPPVPRN
ncbi:MAG TPA: efflux RND transporter periplasmic adaptor subunit [Longimicrobiales bacterium]|nr:efflux RND transporter periplasmic adaptor subunit [Longimicrobiales bacterium]